jgi:AraC-like DNA-binding protein
MVAWCRAGKGHIRTSNQEFDMEAGRFLVLPWQHSIAYHPNPRDPFLVAGIHLIPDHAANAPVKFGVTHDATTEKRKGARRDICIPGLDAAFAGQFSDRPRFRALCEYTVETFCLGTPDEVTMRPLGQILLQELERLTSDPLPNASAIPLELRRMMVYIREHVHGPIRIDELIGLTQLSAATIGRLFRAHLECSPMTWVEEMRLRKAEELLRSSRVSISEAARSVGFDDPYYFSRVFKKVRGISPSIYRRRHRIL